MSEESNFRALEERGYFVRAKTENGTTTYQIGRGAQEPEGSYPSEREAWKALSALYKALHEEHSSPIDGFEWDPKLGSIYRVKLDT